MEKREKTEILKVGTTTNRMVANYYEIMVIMIWGIVFVVAANAYVGLLRSGLTSMEVLAKSQQQNAPTTRRSDTWICSAHN